jgi:hypothetical protein
VLRIRIPNRIRNFWPDPDPIRIRNRFRNKSVKSSLIFRPKKVISDYYGIFQHFQGIILIRISIFATQFTSNLLTDNRIIGIHCPVTFCAGENIFYFTLKDFHLSCHLSFIKLNRVVMGGFTKRVRPVCTPGLPYKESPVYVVFNWRIFSPPQLARFLTRYWRIFAPFLYILSPNSNKNAVPTSSICFLV